jgi:putative hydrolase of the HAD superfamily
MAGHLGISSREFLLLAGPELEGLQSGTLDTSLFWERFAHRSGTMIAEELWGRFFAPVLDTDVLSLLLRLKERGRVVCGTNTIEPHYEIHRRLGDYGCFDAVYASHRMGLMKPAPGFYLHILREEGVAPANALFVDDSPENVEGARRVGIESVLFTDAAALAERLCPPGDATI